MKRWAGKDGLVHIVDDLMGEAYTNCMLTASARFADKLYPPQATDLFPTCLYCIGEYAKWAEARAKMENLVDYVARRTT